jgi:hypothetical protein
MCEKCLALTENVLPAGLSNSNHPSYKRGSFRLQLKKTSPDGSCALSAIAQDCFDKV